VSCERAEGRLGAKLSLCSAFDEPAARYNAAWRVSGRLAASSVVCVGKLRAGLVPSAEPLVCAVAAAARTSSFPWDASLGGGWSNMRIHAAHACAGSAVGAVRNSDMARLTRQLLRAHPSAVRARAVRYAWAHLVGAGHAPWAGPVPAVLE
jgi:hypothetical protein